MSLGNKIRELRHNLGWTQEQLAKQTGLGRSYISLLERVGARPSAGVLLRLAAALGVDVSVLYDAAGYVGSRGTTSVRPLEAIIKELRQRAKLLDVIEVPIKGKIPAPYTGPMEGTYGYLVISKVWVSVNGELFAYQVDSDYLVGEGIQPGEYIIVHAEAPVVDGKIYVVRLPKGVTAGRVYLGEHKLRVTSSTGEYQDIDISGGQIVGRVVLGIRQY